MASDGPDLIVVHASDNAATALRALPAGTMAVARWADGRLSGLALSGAISLGHKVALEQIRKGELVIKYGYPIGRATADIAAGEHVHVHNVLSLSREAGDTVSGVVTDKPDGRL